MKLSEAIVLGDTLKRCNPEAWIYPDGSCGCAFGGALLAAGMKPMHFWSNVKSNTCGAVAELPFVREHWPWITGEHLVEISDLYRKVARGETTIEAVAAYVRTVEPEETEPYQGDQGDEQVQEATEQQHA